MTGHGARPTTRSRGILATPVTQKTLESAPRPRIDPRAASSSAPGNSQRQGRDEVRAEIAIPAPYYIDDTGHFNSVEFNLCAEQLLARAVVGNGTQSGGRPARRRHPLVVPPRDVGGDQILGRTHAPYRRTTEPGRRGVLGRAKAAAPPRARSTCGARGTADVGPTPHWPTTDGRGSPMPQNPPAPSSWLAASPSDNDICSGVGIPTIAGTSVAKMMPHDAGAHQSGVRGRDRRPSTSTR